MLYDNCSEMLYQQQIQEFSQFKIDKSFRRRVKKHPRNNSTCPILDGCHAKGIVLENLLYDEENNKA
jgi:hypothetical protein